MNTTNVISANRLGEEDDWSSHFKNTTTESVEDSLKMQAQMALDAGMTKEEIRISPEWVKAQLGNLGMSTKQLLVAGGVSLGIVLAIIYAIKKG